MGLAEIDRDAVLQAIAEYDEIGQDAFLRRYKFGRAKKYVLFHRGGEYDSKAIVGAAHRYSAGRQLAASDFSGGEQTVGRLRQLGFTVRPRDGGGLERVHDRPRPQLVLIAPLYGNPATRKRFHDTLAHPVRFLGDELRAVLNEQETKELLGLHPEGAARFWGALASHNNVIDRLRQGDLVVFTGQNRVQAIATLGCRLRNETLADLLWPPNPGEQGWLNVYTVADFKQVTGPGYAQLQAWVGSSERDVFQSARLLSPEKSAAVIAGLAAIDEGDGTGEYPGPGGGVEPKLTLSEFETHLAAAEDILRPHVSQLGATCYLLGVLLLKSASDTAELNDGRSLAPADAPNRRQAGLQVPKAARWSTLGRRDGIGAELDQAFRALEDANLPELGGLSDHIRFGGTPGEAGLPDSVLRQLLHQFDEYRVDPDAFESPDLLGAGVDHLIGLAMRSTRGSGQYYTPAEVTQLMVRLLDPADGLTVYDPAAGTGALLVQAAEQVREQGADVFRSAVAGQETEGRIWALAKLNLVLHGIPSTALELGDTLADPKHTRAGTLDRFDRVLSNPPFGQRRSLDDMPNSERFRWSGIPRGSLASELLFVQHVVSVLRTNGIGVILLPRAVMFAGGSERIVRTHLLDDDIIEAVIALPADLPIRTCILVLRAPRSKPDNRAGRVLFVDTETGTDPSAVSSQMDRLLRSYRTFEDAPGFARVVDRAALRTNDDDLSVDRYVSGAADGTPVDTWEAMVRQLVHSGDYDTALAMLEDAATTDPDGLAGLGTEFEFLHIDDADRLTVAAVWGPTASGNSFPLSTETAQAPPTADAESLTSEDTSGGSEPPAGTTAFHRSPQESGAVLEQATIDVFAQLFLIEADTRDVLVTRLRAQRPGMQYGHDVELDCIVAGSPTVRCHVECKNLGRPIKLDDIAGKLWQEKSNPRNEHLDHWILISPHFNPSNEVREKLDGWEKRQEFPFSVQIWSPENGIHGLFAGEPEVYEAVYGRLPGATELAMAEGAMIALQSRLTPRLRLDRVWHRYLNDPLTLCFVNEDARHFDELYTNQLQLRAADREGSLLERTLMDETLAWLADAESQAPLLLLADFGEGKSFFTYSLARRLCADYLRSPETGIVPLRIPLREFSQAGDGRALLQRRLDELGADLAQWRDLARHRRTLVILDGFDEMSTDLSPAAITRNLRDIASCLGEFGESKVLVTSRQRILDGGRDWARILDRLRQPRVLRIAPGSRAQRVRYLEQFATDDRSTQALENLRNLYDPIGLAAKPLFLQMIRATLSELSTETFSELGLYDTYVRKSLQRKIELFDDNDLRLTGTELIENLLEILEDIAVDLQRANQPYIYLRNYSANTRAGIAAMLWRMRDDTAPESRAPSGVEDDATARIGVRALLKAVSVPGADPQQWPVDFFHRSMREYFFARALVRRLGSENQDPARRILESTRLPPEISHFAAELLRRGSDPASLARLTGFVRSAALGLDSVYQGGNAISLLYAALGALPAYDWSDLRLDYAQLSGADLTEFRFAGSSLRDANLDNANLTGVDFTNANLEGVRLEETARVSAATVLADQRIVAAYEDGTLRGWHSQPNGTVTSHTIATLDHPVERLYPTPRGRLVAIGDGRFSLLDPTGKRLSLRSTFGTKSRFRPSVPGQKSTLFLEEISGGRTRIVWSDPKTTQVLDHRDEAMVTSYAQADGRAYAIASEESVRLVLHSDRDIHREWLLAHSRVSCLDLHVRRDGDVLLAVGRHDGTVTVERLSASDPDTPPALLWQRDLHTGTVTTIALSDDERLITGGADRVIHDVRTGLGGFGAAEPQVQDLHLTLRCKGVKFDGVRTAREQERLRQYSVV